MAKWKCEVCGNEFENFHAQGFDNKIYCPLCYFKKENQELKKQLEDYKYSHSCSFVDTCKNVKIANFNQQKEFINYLEDEYTKIQSEIEKETNNNNAKYFKIERRQTITGILQKYKEIIGDKE